ncbi:MAG: ATP-binding protein [Erysipelotrichaceae bacterium]|nr:ATP-binding protein [Erysipelotrichaceae bacterium]
MMEDLAMQMLELLMNSIQAGAENITLEITDSLRNDCIVMLLLDDGKGMSKELLERVSDPFTTTRKTRKVGLGVSFMKGLCESCDGSFAIESEEGKGTKVRSEVRKSHLDTPPLGDLGAMMMYAIQANEDINYTLSYRNDQNEFVFRSTEVRKELDGVSMLEPEILLWIKEYINQNIKALEEG